MLELEEFKRETLQAVVDGSADRNPATYPLAAAFPEEKTVELNAVYSVIKQSVRAAASITGFNSGAPLRSRGEGEQMLAKLTKMQHAYYLDEVDILNIKTPRTPEERQAIIDKVYYNTAELGFGVDDIKELIRAELTYRGRFHYANAKDNMEIEFELDRPSANNITVTTKWDQDAATPLSDIEAAITQFQKTNGRKKPDFIVMNSATYAVLRKHPQIKAEVYGTSTDTRIVKDSDFRELLTSLGFPTIEIDDNATGIEQLDGSIAEVEHIARGQVCLRAAVLGKTLVGPAVENNARPGKFVKKVVEDDPTTEKTIVGEVALPVLQAVNSTVLMTVL
ncbi:major capsid protein [Macrococcus brunensis]|uniref:major capsid protein n=1 Tax=Macrococcus brunensis TaxID=198483 RepID=UPI001EEF7CF1|nr:major capsid protein [Macrococcus brunensis]ULG73025.1 major capsid protein [Macrococcus brunensis]